MSTRIYAIRHFNGYDAKVLASTITLLQSRTRDLWTRGTVEDAEVEFINVDTPEGAESWKSNGRAIKVCCSNRKLQSTYYVPRPIRLRSLGAVLERLEGDPMTNVVDIDAPAGAARPRGDDAYQPNQGMLGYLYKVRRDGRQAVFHVREFAPLFPPPNLYVDGARQVFAWSDEETPLSELCALPPNGFTAQFLKLDDYARHVMPKQERSLDRLLWMAAVHGSGGRPWNGLTPDLPVSLEEAPDSEILPLSPGEEALGNRLLRTPHTPAELASLSGRPPADIMAFLNGCIALGLLPEPGSARVVA